MDRGTVTQSICGNALFLLGYYSVCSYNKLIARDILCSHLKMQTISNLFYTLVHTYYDAPKSLNGIDVIPVALILCTKTPTVSWQSQAIITTILGGAQISIMKAVTPNKSSSSPRPFPRHFDTQWLDGDDIWDYYVQLEKRYPEAHFEFQYSYGAKGLAEEITKMTVRTDKKKIFLPVLVSGNHSALVYLDLDRHTIEYFESKKEYGNFDEIMQQLERAACVLSISDPEEATFTYESKIQKCLQPDSYQCAVWVLYFSEQLLKDPHFDFNALDVETSQKMIADFRKKVIPYLKGSEQWCC